MSFFGDLQIDENTLPTEDKTGGFTPLESGVYLGVIQSAYGIESQRGAKGVRIETELQVNGKPRKYTQTFWITNAKGETTYEYNGEKRALAGFNHINSITNLICGKSISQMVVKDVSVKIGDKHEPVPMLVELIDKPIALAILKIRENKREKQGNEYVATAEAQFVNEVDYVFNQKGLSYLEYKNGVTEPKFIHEWKKSNDGETRNKYKEVKEQAGSVSTSSGSTIDFS